MGSKRVNLLNTEWTQYTSSQSLRNLLKVQRYFHTILRHTASLSFHCEGLGPGTLCCSATISAPRHSSPQQQNTKKLRNHMGLSACAVGANYRQKIQRDQKTHLPLLKSLEQKSRGSGAKAGNCAWPLHTMPPKGWANQPDPWTHTCLHTPLHPPTPKQASQRACWLFSLATAAAGTSTKPCLNFFSGLWIISIDSGGQEP